MNIIVLAALLRGCRDGCKVSSGGGGGGGGERVIFVCPLFRRGLQAHCVVDGCGDIGTFFAAVDFYRDFGGFCFVIPAFTELSANNSNNTTTTSSNVNNSNNSTITTTTSTNNSGDSNCNNTHNFNINIFDAELNSRQPGLSLQEFSDIFAFQRNTLMNDLHCQSLGMYQAHHHRQSQGHQSLGMHGRAGPLLTIQLKACHCYQRRRALFPVLSLSLIYCTKNLPSGA